MIGSWRKLLAASLAALALILPVCGNVNSAQATPRTGQTRLYWVYYREYPDDPWRVYGGYYNYQRALQAANYFRYYGYDVFIR